MKTTDSQGTASDSQGNRIRALRIIVSFLQAALPLLTLWAVVGALIDPRLIYHGGGELTNFPIFLKTQAFWRESLAVPGGLLHYLVALLAQGMFLCWTGAALLALHMGLLGLAVYWVLSAPKIPYRPLWSGLAAGLMLSTYNHYTYHLDTASGVLAALWTVVLYQRLNRRLRAWPCFVTLVLVLYVLAGAPALLFVLCTVLLESLFQGQWRRAGGFLLFGGLVPLLIGTGLYSTSPLNAYTDGLSLSWKILDFPIRTRMLKAIDALFLMMPVLLLVFGLLRDRSKSQTSPPLPLRLLRGPWPFNAWTAMVSLVTPLALFAIALAVSTAPQRKLTFEIHRDLYEERWDDILKIPVEQRYSPYAGHATLRALCHTDQISTSLFDYPQHPTFLFLAGQDYQQSHWKRLGLFWDLGLNNQCECALAEALELHGHRPMLLERLAWVRMVKGDLQTARVCLETLRCHPFWTRVADPLLAQLRDDPDLSDNAEIQRRRQLALASDEQAITFNMREQLLALLDANPHNKTAFDLLMATCAITKKLPDFAKNLSRIKAFGATQLPPVYEQVLLSYLFTHKAQSPLIALVSPEAKARFNTFLKASQPYGSNKAAAYPTMLKQFGDTYYFYYVFQDLKR